MFDHAEQDARVGVARKTMPVDIRPAEPGEVVVTVIAGEGEETRSPPAQPGDMVVRNRCPATGNEEILVSAAKFAGRYEGPIGPADAGWQPYRPRGIEMRYFVVRDADGTFTFTAPWGEPIVARPGDAIVRDPQIPRTLTGSPRRRSSAPTRSSSRHPERVADPRLRGVGPRLANQILPAAVLVRWALPGGRRAGNLPAEAPVAQSHRTGGEPSCPMRSSPATNRTACSCATTPGSRISNI
jgi:hypothetical protein